MVSNPSTYNVFPHTVVGLCGDVAMSTNASALNKLLRTIKLAGVNLIIVLRLKKNIDFKLYVYKHINK